MVSSCGGWVDSDSGVYQWLSELGADVFGTVSGAAMMHLLSRGNSLASRGREFSCSRLPFGGEGSGVRGKSLQGPPPHPNPSPPKGRGALATDLSHCNRNANPRGH